MSSISRFFLLFFLISGVGIYADTVIEFGRNNNQIGIDKSDEGIWKPLFFDIDGDSNIYIPDFYKGRIAVFNSDGELLKSIKVSEGISPRMNYFCLNDNDTFTTYDNYTLYQLSADGVVTWKVSMGLGAIPVRIYNDSRGIFIKFSRGDYFHYAFSSDKLLGNVEDIIQYDILPVKDAMLVFQDKESNIWITNGKHRSVIIGDTRFPVPSNSTDGSGYWVIRGGDGGVYSALYGDGCIKILDLY